MSMDCTNSFDSCTGNASCGCSADCREESEFTNVTRESPTLVLGVTPLVKDNHVAVTVSGGDARNVPCCEPYRGASQVVSALEKANER